ncbi:solute carrier family 12 member 9 [Neocloeon triangulifer]|uniref:solute carrier family 12 member 9 n=1 Tax=Neocloeon triangulifer TaxID=2078957 RepID=UPI00286EC8FF|nr:solute carrier family 12 member 9 [Neocloeon triangulifer]
MLAPEIGSTNSTNAASFGEPRSEKSPLIHQRRLFHSFQGLFETPNQGNTLGTFAGVFSPVALSMFSALLFLRVGFIVGNAGLLTTLLQFLIAYCILVFTVASVCAVSTNGAVEGGGAYFMISRTLGPEFGGSIGTLFFVANIVSSALYITGCIEGVVDNFSAGGYLVGVDSSGIPDGRWWRFLYCSVLNLINLGVCLIGAGLFAKTSVAVLGVVCICVFSSIISFFIKGSFEIPIPDANELFKNSTASYTGLNSTTLYSNLWPQYVNDYTVPGGEMTNFAAVFGVLFSGVTGIMAGANMSGELREPGKSIPRGTLSAVAFTFVCYVIISILTAATCTPKLLQNDYIFMQPINLWPPFVVIGVLMATFSASLSNLIGSSRVLEALAKDNIFGSLLNVVVRGNWANNPVVAVIISWVSVQLILLIGSLNLIAQINSVLFLLSYLALNLACLGLELASAPNFRPSFKYFTWHTALIGLVGTLIMMFIINPVYASCSLALCLLLVVVLHLFSPAKASNWGSISQALIFHQVRKYLLLLDSRKAHVKFWRPQMLLLVGSPRSACPLIDFVNDLKKSGLYVLGHVKIGTLEECENDIALEETDYWLALIDHLKVKAFVELTMARSVREGMRHLVRLSGLGAMKPNTIVLGFYDSSQPRDFLASADSSYQSEAFRNIASNGAPLFTLRNENNRMLTHSEYVGIICDTLKLQKNVALCRHFHSLDKSSLSNSNFTYIDVWPINFFNPSELDPFDESSLFMLQLACIINMTPSWKKLKLRVMLCTPRDGLPSGSQVEEVQIEPDINQTERKMQYWLQQLRISAQLHTVSWEFPNESHEGPPPLPTVQHMQGINHLIRQKSDHSAAIFVYLPSPPDAVHGESPVAEAYLNLLTELTQGLPPTILVRGVSAVISTTL